MNFLNLYYFRVAAEELSFTNAASVYLYPSNPSATTFPAWKTNSV